MRIRFQFPGDEPRAIAAAVTLCLGIALSGCGPAAEEIREDDPPAVVALKKAGAKVERQPSMLAPNMIGRTVDLSETSLEPDVLQHLAEVKGLLSLTMTGAKVTDETLAQIPEVRSVTSLDLTSAQVTDQGLKHLAVLPSLATVNLTDTNVTGPGLADLPPTLGGVILTNLPISDDDLLHLDHLKDLRMLVLTGTEVTAAGVNKIKQGRPRLLTVGVKLK